MRTAAAATPYSSFATRSRTTSVVSPRRNASKSLRFGDGHPPCDQESITLWTGDAARFAACSATRSIVGRYGTLLSSHEQFT